MISRRFRNWLLASVLIAMVAFGASAQDMALLLALVIAACGGWWLTELKPGRGMPRWVSGLLLVGVVLAAILRTADVESAVKSFSGFLSSLIIVKLWERRELRDYGQILTMSLFLTIGATLDDNSLPIGAMLVAQMVAIVAATMLYQLHAGQAKARQAAAGSDGAAPTSAADDRQWRAIRGRFWRVVGGSVVAAALIGVVVFIFVPRGIGLQQLGNFARPAFGRVTGFSGMVQLGQGGLISESQTIVMEAQFRDQNDRLLGTLGRIFYLRGAVLEQYDRGRWTEGRPIVSDAQVTPNRVVTLSPPLGAMPAQVTAEVSMRSNAGSGAPLFTLYRPLRLKVGADGAVRINERTLTLTFDGDPGRLEYSFTSVPDQPPPDGLFSRRPEVGFDSDRIRELASRLLREAQIEPDPAARPVNADAAAARVLETWLRTTFSYTLDIMAAPADEEPIEWFLFDAKTGHCEYFASALAAMCRSVGINARVVTGYVAAEVDPGTGIYIVRESNAHAWVEVNVGGSSWQTFDATPPGDLATIHSGRPGWQSRMARLFDRIEQVWATSVVSFDRSTQQRLIGAEGRGRGSSVSERTLSWLSERLNRDRSRGYSRREVVLAMVIMALVTLAPFLILIGLFFGLRLIRVWWKSRPRTMPGEAGGIYKSLLDVLAAVGHPKPRWKPLIDHIRSVGERDPEIAAAAEPVATRLYAARYGGADLSGINAGLDAVRAAAKRTGRRTPTR